MSHFFDRDGKPISLARWCELFESRFHGSEYYRVAISRGYGYEVSTVWTGVDYSFGSGEPLIFETMIFIADHEPDEPRQALDYQERYSTETEAMEGHAKAAEVVKQYVAKMPRQIERGDDSTHALRLSAVYGGSGIALWCQCQALGGQERYRGAPIEVRQRWTMPEAKQVYKTWHERDEK